MTQVDETGHIEIVEPLCHYCGEPLSGECVNDIHTSRVYEINQAMAYENQR